METNTIVISQNNGLKNVIIAKAWKPNPETGRQGSMKVSRDLSQDIVLKPGTTLNVNFNNQRDGKQDADYSVSVLLPTATADQLIEEMKASVAKRTAECIEEVY